MNKLRVLLAEDHHMVREGIKKAVNAESDMEVIGEASDGIQALELVLEKRPDVTLMDILMPGLDGLEVTRKIMQEWPEAKILALTGYEDRHFLQELLEDGASGYILKMVSQKEVIEAIRIVASGSPYLDSSTASEMYRGYLNKNTDGFRVRLSDRETEVVRRIAQGFSNKEIALQLNISVKTVETYKARAMEKLQLHSRADIVRYAIKQGWLRIKPDVV
jgi:two-component system, NarL family, response regulator NreC